VALKEAKKIKVMSDYQNKLLELQEKLAE